MNEKPVYIELFCYQITNDDGEVNVYTLFCGNYTSYDTLERGLMSIYRQIHGNSSERDVFVTFEHIADPETFDEAVLLREIRQYRVVDGNATLIHSTKSQYKGRETEDAYSKGDIIEYIDRDSVSTGIIRDCPITSSSPIASTLCLDMYDDSYLVYELGDNDTHQHVMSVYVIGKADVDNVTRGKYVEKLLSMESNDK